MECTARFLIPFQLEENAAELFNPTDTTVVQVNGSKLCLKWKNSIVNKNEETLSCPETPHCQGIWADSLLI